MQSKTFVLALALAMPQCATGFLAGFARPTTSGPPSLANVVGVAPTKDMPADYGFDPLGFAGFDLHLGSAADKDRTSEAIIYDYREAELRHGRLAMLAAAAWPLQELLSPALSRTFHVPALLAATAGRSPSVLNGGLDQAGIPVLLALTAVAISSLDLYALQVKEEKGDAWLPGDLGFDPLRLLKGASPAAVRDMQAKEVNNGRLAMLAVLGYVVEEAVTGKPIVYLTSGLFQPLYENDGVRHAMDAAFSASTF